MTRTSSLALVCLLFSVVSASAQGRRQQPQPRRQPAPIMRSDTTIKSTTLEVYQQYEPEIKPVTKPELTPTLLPPPAAKTPQRYEVPQQTLYYSYRALPLRPLALGRDTAEAPPSNYALLAGGNLSTILGEVGVGSLRGRNWQSLLQGRYIRQEGNPSDQIYRSLRVRGDGTLRAKAHLWEGGLGLQRDVFGAYGYDHDVLKYSFDNVKRVYTAFNLSAGMQNEQPAWLGLSYHPQLSFTYYTGTILDHERSLRLLLPVRKQIDSNLSAEFGVNTWITRSSLSATSWDNNIFQLTPRIAYAGHKFDAQLGLYPTFASGAHLLPDLVARYRFGAGLSVEGGWQATLTQNTIQQLTAQNPFTNIAPANRQRTRRDDAFAGLHFALGKHLSVSGRAAWNQWRGLPLFITVPGGDGKEFQLLYDPNVQAIVWNAGVRYAIAEDFSLSAEGNWYNYYKHSYARVWGEPGVRLKGRAAWQAIRGLDLSMYAEVLDQIWGLDAQSREVKLRGVFELGAAAEYTVVERLNLLLRAENLLGRRNERWQGYPSFGFNIYGGLRFRF